MKLLIVTEDPHEMVGEGIYTTNPVVEFFLSLTNEVDQVRYCCPLRVVETRDARLAQKVQIKKNLTVVPRPFFFHKKEIFKRPIDYLWSSVILLKEFFRSDVILYRVPTPFIFVLYFSSFIFEKKFVVYIAGDFFSRNVSSLADSRIKLFPKKIIVNIYDFLEKRIATRLFCIATGKELCEKYHCSPFYTSLISKKSISGEVRILDKDNLKLLYVGRLDFNKGVQDLLKVIDVLNNDLKIHALLTIVGEGSYRAELESRAELLNVTDYISFVGSVPYGDELLDYFREASIFVLPSYSEGVPKVLFDAMSVGLPIIATCVGGVTGVVKHEETALMVNPRSHMEIVGSVMRYIGDAELLKRITKQSLAEAHRNSMEARVKLLATILRKRLDNDTAIYKTN